MGCAGSAPRPKAKPTSTSLGAVTQPQAQQTAEQAIELQMDGVEGVSPSPPLKGTDGHEGRSERKNWRQKSGHTHAKERAISNETLDQAAATQD